MKSIRIIATLLFAFAFTAQGFASNAVEAEKKTAVSVFEFAQNMETMDREVLEAEIDQLSLSEKIKLANLAIADAKAANANGVAEASAGLYILAIFIPPVAVGIFTDWDVKPTLINLVLTFIGWLPGVVHAFIVLSA